MKVAAQSCFVFSCNFEFNVTDSRRLFLKGAGMANIILNPDEEVVRRIRAGLAAKGGYCPCKLGQKEENKCMCEEFRAQIADPDFEGFCHCTLYYKKK